MAGAGLGVASRVSIGALLLGCSQAGLSSSLPVSFPEPLPTGLFSPQHHPRTAQLLIPDRTWYVGPLWASVSPSLIWVCGLVIQWRPCRQRAGSGAWDLCSLCLSLVPSLPPPGVSRGPSPVVLGSQDALPVATAFTEYVHAYFRGHNPRYTVVGHSADGDRQT